MKSAAALLQLICQPLHQHQWHRVVPYAAVGAGMGADVVDGMAAAAQTVLQQKPPSAATGSCSR
jgi:hypothetical protein